MNGLSVAAAALSLPSFAAMSMSSGWGASSRSQGSAATVSIDFSNVLTRDAWVLSPENLKPGADTELRLSAYTMFTQRLPSLSQLRHVHDVPPGVWPGVKCAVIASGPRVSVSPFLRATTSRTAGNELCG